MLFLLGSIVFTSYLTIAFKLCDRFGINKFQAIVFNYLSCALTGVVFTMSWPDFADSVQQPWFKWAILMGLSFVSIFNLIALTVQKSGLAVASVASKLSLIIPFLFSIWLYHDEAPLVKILGVILALVAVVLTLYPSAPVQDAGGKSRRLQRILLPVVVFITTGLLDTMIKYVESSFIHPANHNQYLIVTFFIAFFGGFLGMIFQLASGKAKFQPKAILAGIAIGIPNYFSIWFLVKVLAAYKENSSVILPVNNMGIVLFSAIVAWLLFREKLSKLNWAGIALSIIAILLIALGAS